MSGTEIGCWIFKREAGNLISRISGGIMISGNDLYHIIHHPDDTWYAKLISKLRI